MLTIVPISLKEANAFVDQHHRHHESVCGHKFSVAASGGGGIVGVAIVGRPRARNLQDGRTLEVVRLATDGSRNACSLLYAASWRAARAMGYGRLITYILESEPGTSLKGAGWKEVHRTKAETWDRASRPRTGQPLQNKLRWEVSHPLAQENSL